jgi:hypothetical protein
MKPLIVYKPEALTPENIRIWLLRAAYKGMHQAIQGEERRRRDEEAIAKRKQGTISAVHLQEAAEAGSDRRDVAGTATAGGSA